MYDPISDTLTFNFGHIANVIGVKHNDENLIDIFKKNRKKIDAVVISGSRLSPMKGGERRAIPDEIINSEKPILGICYGYEWYMMHDGAKLEKMDIPENTAVKAILKDVPLFKGLPRVNSVYMSHNKVVANIPSGYEKIAETDLTEYAGVQNIEKKFWGLQFHPEKTWLSEIIFRNFLDIIKDL